MTISSSPMKTINFVTSNLSKLEEVHAILTSYSSFKLVHYSIELPELQASLDEIAIHKCMAAAAAIQNAALIEDTALGFSSLNGLPGPYIKTFIQKIGLKGLIRVLSDYQDKSTTATSTFAYTEGPNQPIKLFTGTMHGKIIESPFSNLSQTNWRSIFQPDGYHINYTIMDQTTQNKISHRYKALMLLVDFLR